MKHIILFLICLGGLLEAAAQPRKAAVTEQQQALAELKKEIASLQAEIKNLEASDPEETALLRKQLATYQSLLAAMDPAKATAKKPVIAVNNQASKLTSSRSPLVPVVLRQPVQRPTAAQAIDRFFWYRGKKINDSTLITPKGIVVQYSAKRTMLIVQPDKKEDSLSLRMAKELEQTEKRKTQMIGFFDQTKNGFIFYPHLEGALAEYDDLSIRYNAAIKNTIQFDPTDVPPPSVIRPKNKPAGKGPWADAAALDNSAQEDIIEWATKRFEQAKKMFDGLPPVNSFPAPTYHEEGLCASCDTAYLSAQRKKDAAWAEQYLGKEQAIAQLATSTMHQLSVADVEDSGLVDEFNSLTNKLFLRMDEKNGILIDGYGDQFQYAKTIAPVILGHERQKALLGFDSGDGIGKVTGMLGNQYEKYYREQVAARNHDFVLNLPLHLGVERQRALLGVEPQTIVDVFQRFLQYNRFSMTLDVDFAYEHKSDDGQLSYRTTGNMGTTEKMYIMAVPENCRYRMISYQADITNRKLEDISLRLQVKSGIKTIPDPQSDKMKDIPYSGPKAWATSFPDIHFDFCNRGVPDTVLFGVFGGDEETAAAASAMMSDDLSNVYNVEMGTTLPMVFYGGEGSGGEAEIVEKGTDVLDQIGSMYQQGAPTSTLEKLRQEHSGYMNMDNLRKDFVGAINSKKAQFVFEAANRATVLTDTYHDSKRTIQEGMYLTKGLAHLRIVHEPLVSK